MLESISSEGNAKWVKEVFYDTYIQNQRKHTRM